MVDSSTALGGVRLQKNSTGTLFDQKFSAEIVENPNFYPDLFPKFNQ